MESLMTICCLQDKTGTLDGKVWDPNSQGIADYDEKDFIEVFGEVISYNGNLQMNIKQIRKAARGRIQSGGLYADYQRRVWTVCMRSCLPISVRFPTLICVKLLEYYFVNDDRIYQVV